MRQIVNTAPQCNHNGKGARYLVAVKSSVTACAPVQDFADVCIDLTTGEAARLSKTLRHARLVVIESSKELPLARTTEAFVEDRKRIAFVAVDLRDQVTQVLQVDIPDLRSAAHHESSDQDQSVLAVELVLLGSVLGQEPVAEAAGIEPLADGCNQDSQLSGVLLSLVECAGLWRREHVGLVYHAGQGNLGVARTERLVDVENDVQVLVALEQTCRAKGESACLRELQMVECDSRWPQRPMMAYLIRD